MRASCDNSKAISASFDSWLSAVRSTDSWNQPAEAVSKGAGGSWAAGTLWLLGVDGSASYWVEILPGSLLQGLGIALTVAPLTASVLGAAPNELAGVASGVNNAVARAASCSRWPRCRSPSASRATTTPSGRLTDGYRDGHGGVRRDVRRRRLVAWRTIRNDVLQRPIHWLDKNLHPRASIW